MNQKTRKQKCSKNAEETLARFITARRNKRYKVVGRRIPTKKQQKQIIKTYTKACIKDLDFIKALK